MTEPYGDVIELPIQWNTKPVFKWDYFIKQPLWDHDDIDKTKYIEFIGGKMVKLDKGCCRLCGKKVLPYSTKYYQVHNDEGMKYSILFCADNFYCEECARKETEKMFINKCLPDLVSVSHKWENDNYLEIREYSDGSIIEPRTYEEIQAERARCGWKY